VFACVLAGFASPLPLFLCIALVTGSQGLMMAPCQVLALSTDPLRVGAASGLMGFMHMVLAAGASQFGGFIYDHTTFTPGLLVLALELACFAAFFLSQRSSPSR
jgi:hypothetical protein